ncbi:hypothetical protein BDV06DRAFT_191458 [Aspergillus oleicola]
MQSTMVRQLSPRCSESSARSQVPRSTSSKLGSRFGSRFRLPPLVPNLCCCRCLISRLKLA